MKKAYIFGAHSRGRTLAEYLREVRLEEKLLAFLVDNDEENPDRIDGFPVILLNRDADAGLEKDAAVYLGIRGAGHGAVTERLRDLGFSEIIPVTVELDIELRNEYLEKKFAVEKRPFEKIGNLPASGNAEKSGCIYVVRSIYDKPLSDSKYVSLPEEKLIQVGTALTEERISECSFRDNTGENISEKNRQYCEETALYWIWKNAREDIIGLVHYRRHFLLPDDWQLRMEKHGIDVILPTPLYLPDSIGENFCFRHEASNWTYLMDFLKDRNYDEYLSAKEYYSGNIFCPCNMFIMRREVLSRYCSWLFPILFELEKNGGILDDTYQNRYPAFMAERLLSWYFEMHKAEYYIVYSDKNFLA